MSDSISPIAQPLDDTTKEALSEIGSHVSQLKTILENVQLQTGLTKEAGKSTQQNKKVQNCHIQIQSATKYAETVLDQIRQLQNNSKHYPDAFHTGILALYKQVQILSTDRIMLSISNAQKGGRSFGMLVHQYTLPCIEKYPMNAFNSNTKKYLDPMKQGDNLDSKDIALINGYIYYGPTLNEALNQRPTEALPAGTKVDLKYVDIKAFFKEGAKGEYTIPAHSIFTMLEILNTKDNHAAFQKPVLLSKNPKSTICILLVSENQKAAYAKKVAKSYQINFLSYERLSVYARLSSMGVPIQEISTIDKKLDDKPFNNQSSDYLSNLIDVWYQPKREQNLAVIQEEVLSLAEIANILNRMKDNTEFSDTILKELKSNSFVNAKEALYFVQLIEEKFLEAPCDRASYEKLSQVLDVSNTSTQATGSTPRSVSPLSTSSAYFHSSAQSFKEDGNKNQELINKLLTRNAKLEKQLEELIASSKNDGNKMKSPEAFLTSPEIQIQLATFEASYPGISKAISKRLTHYTSEEATEAFKTLQLLEDGNLRKNYTTSDRHTFIQNVQDLLDLQESLKWYLTLAKENRTDYSKKEVILYPVLESAIPTQNILDLLPNQDDKGKANELSLQENVTYLTKEFNAFIKIATNAKEVMQRFLSETTLTFPNSLHHTQATLGEIYKAYQKIYSLEQNISNGQQKIIQKKLGKDQREYLLVLSTKCQCESLEEFQKIVQGTYLVLENTELCNEIVKNQASFTKSVQTEVQAMSTSSKATPNSGSSSHRDSHHSKQHRSSRPHHDNRRHQPEQSKAGFFRKLFAADTRHTSTMHSHRRP